MKVGTDGVLLGAWASLASGEDGEAVGFAADGAAAGVAAGEAVASVADGVASGTAETPVWRALDIGTGTGLVALMLAQRASAGVWGIRPFRITAVEMDTAAAAQARGNVAASPWASAMQVVTDEIGHWVAAHYVSGNAAIGRSAARFDLVVCNPPFYTRSLKGPDAARNAARHNDLLPPDVLFGAAAACLKPAPAAFNLILPAEQEAAAIETAVRHGLRPVRRCRVFTAASAAAPLRVLLAFSLASATASGPAAALTRPPSLPPAGTLHLYEAPGCFSAAYRRLVEPFYLHM